VNGCGRLLIFDHHMASKSLFVYTAALLVTFLWVTPLCSQQYELKGTVYDITQKTALDGVIVMATNGKGVLTDSFGRYKIMVRERDSVWFSYQGKQTAKYPLFSLEDPTQFNMALHVYVHALPNVIVRPKNYRMDSLANRMEYAKYFNYSKPNPLKSVNVANGGVGMDANEIINIFRFRRNRSLEMLQKRLLEDEQTKYVDYRFNKAFVIKLTNLSGEPLNVFMKKYRPPYDFVVLTNELELGFYIQQCYRQERGELPRNVVIYNLQMTDLQE